MTRHSQGAQTNTNTESPSNAVGIMGIIFLLIVLAIVLWQIMKAPKHCKQAEGVGEPNTKPVAAGMMGGGRAFNIATDEQKEENLPRKLMGGDDKDNLYRSEDITVTNNSMHLKGALCIGNTCITEEHLQTLAGGVPHWSVYTLALNPYVHGTGELKFNKIASMNMVSTGTGGKTFIDGASADDVKIKTASMIGGKTMTGGKTMLGDISGKTMTKGVIGGKTMLGDKKMVGGKVIMEGNEKSKIMNKYPLVEEDSAQIFEHIEIIKPGRYLLSFSGFAEVTGDTTQQEFVIIVNDIAVARTYNGWKQANRYGPTASVSVIRYLNKGDKVRVIQSQGAPLHMNWSSYFTGLWISA